MTADTISTLIENDLANTEQLSQLLKNERLQLETRNLEALQSLLQQKTELLASIERNGKACKNLLQQAGFPGTRQGMKEYCQQLGLEDSFTALQDNLRKCKELTLINGAIVHRSRINTLKIIDILRGIPTGAGLYTHAGESAHATEFRSLGNA
ncbi:MAG: flagellar protein FlgN [Pseudomonadales bacterium]|nr:flagellar protein FlgN [Pseudomonadales bacterium]